MPAYNVFHGAVKRGLIKEGWTITADPYFIQFGGIDQYIDIAAEKLIGAERGEQRIAIEVKSFTSSSMVTEFHAALGQFLHYRMVLEKEDPDRVLYLAVPIDAFDSFFSLLFARTSIQRHGVHLIVYDPESEALIQWIKQHITES
jgi:XisH protein